RNAELYLVGMELRESGLPGVVAGDMNDVAWSSTTRLFQKVSRTLDPRIGRGFYNTFHARHPWLRYSLDHIFHTPDFTLSELRRLEYFGSDHFPMLVRLFLDPQGPAEQAPPTLDSEDQAQVAWMSGSVAYAEELRRHRSAVEKNRRADGKYRDQGEGQGVSRRETQDAEDARRDSYYQ